jgi:hypothetical protein
MRRLLRSIGCSLVRRPRAGAAGGGERPLVPARRAVAVVVAALLACGLLDADGLAGSVSQQQYGTPRTVELALVRPLRTVSHWTGLDLPRRWLMALRGNTGGGPPARFAAPGPAPARPVRTPAPGPARAPANPPGSGPGPVNSGQVPAFPQPPPFTPSAARPLRVWLAGDSMMGEIAQAFEESEAGDPAMTVSDTVEIGTGLARPDVYNWPAAVAREMSVADPDVVVVIFGANDDQDMMVNGSRVVLGTPAWQAEYARRVGEVADAVTAAHRTVVWLEVPSTARPQINRTDAVIDRVLTQAAGSHPGMQVVNLNPAVAPTGAYQEYLPGASGQPVEIRDSDGVHLTPAGGQRVAPLILAAIRRRWPHA